MPDQRKLGDDMLTSRHESSDDSLSEKVKDAESNSELTYDLHHMTTFTVSLNATIDHTMANPAEKDNAKANTVNLANSTNHHNKHTLGNSDSRTQQAKMANH